MIFVPKTMLKTICAGAMMFCVSQAHAALESPSAISTTNITAIPNAFVADEGTASHATTTPVGIMKSVWETSSALSLPSVAKIDRPLLGEVANTERLRSLRGGTDTVTTEAKLGGAVTGNAAMNVLTGSNIIDAGSFSNATGMPIVIQNTGANVLIQNATVINLQMK